MREYTASDFLSADVRIREIIGAVCRRSPNWARNRKVPREYDGLVFFTEGKIEYDFDGELVLAGAGDVLVIPRGIPYCGRALSQGPFTFEVIDLLTEETEELQKYPLPYCFRPAEGESVYREFRALEMLWAADGFCRRTEIRGRIYALMGELTRDYAENICHYNEKNRVLRMTEYVQNHFRETGLSVERMAERFHISPSQLRRVFAQELGISPGAYLSRIRLERAKALLRSCPELSVGQISADCGYSSPYYFSALFREKTGKTPTEYRSSED